jgi:N-acetylglucosaminyldiphosphoundecaprenol N-acetyl-beta-D-mannosaminyltransferase
MVMRGNILGVGISAINMKMTLEVIDGWFKRREQHYLIAAPAHCLVDCQRDEALRYIYNNAGMVTPDGMPLVWILKLMGFRGVDRVCGSDLMLAVCEHGLREGYRHYLYGSTPEVIERLVKRLGERFPSIQIVGAHAPPFPYTAEYDGLVVKQINAVKPDIVWCGLGAAKEEVWTSQHVGKVTAPILIGVGAAFDFHSGTKPQAPRWMQRAGLEWAFRLANEPRRLWRRYLIGNPLFLWLVLLQALNRRTFSMEGSKQ